MKSCIWDEEFLGKPSRNSRREAREAVLQMLYALEFHPKEKSELIGELCLPFTDEAQSFIQSLLDSVGEHKKEIDTLIREIATNWEFSRIFIIDRILLEIAIAEFLFCEDIPPKVTINEAIEIGKRFGTDKSSQFINGILDAAYSKLKSENKICKTGRGLLN